MSAIERLRLCILKLTWVRDGTRFGAVGLIFWYELHQVGDNTQKFIERAIPMQLES